MKYADVKSNIKQHKRSSGCILQIIISNFKTSNTKKKRVCIFYLILVSIPPILILPIKNMGVGEWGGCLTDKIR